MNTGFNINDNERERIISLHESATKRQYLSEQVVTDHDSKYDYKKEGGDYFYKSKGTNNWKKSSGNSLESIKTRVFNEKPSKPKTTTSKSKSELPFKTNEEGDKFREWMNRWYPKTSKNLQLDRSGSHTNSYIRRAWNHKGTGGIKGDIYTEKVLSKGGGKSSPKIKGGEKGNIFVSDTINPSFSSKIDFSNLSTSNSTENICKPGTKHCAAFVNKFTDKFPSIGNAWDAYRNDTILGPTINSKFKGLDESQRKDVIELWLKIHKNGGGKENGPYNNEVKSFVNQLVPSKGSEVKLEIDDIVGIFYPGSSHHEEAFYQGGEAWFINKNGKMVPGNTIQRGDGWGMNTHVGIVGAIKDGVPLIFHNVGGTAISDPASNLRIAWVKRKGGSKLVQVEHPVIKKTLEDLVKNRTNISEQPDSVMDRRLGITSKNEKAFEESRKRIESMKNKYPCVNASFRVPLDVLLNKGYNKDVLKLSLGIIGRESSFASGLRYSTMEPVKELWAWLGGSTSVGPAQMKPETAKSLGLDFSKVTTNVGALDGVYRFLLRAIKKAKNEGYSSGPSSMGSLGTGNAIYDIAVASYNLGLGRIHKWCETNNPKIKRDCKFKGKMVESVSNINEQSDFVMDRRYGMGEYSVNPPAKKTYKVSDKVVQNYIPNFKNKRWDGVNISTQGYVKEVAGYYKKLNCF